MFTTEHFVWLGICAALIALLTFVSLKFKFSFRTSAFIMAGVAFASEMCKIFSHMEPVDSKDPSKGMVIEAGALPFHLCSLLIFAFMYLPFSKNEKLKQYLINLTVPVGLIGSLLALVMATSGTDFAQPFAYQCFIYHAVLTWFAIYLVAAGHAELGCRSWLTNILSLFCLAVGMIWLNGLLQTYDTNFLYVVRPPVDGLPILNLDNGWYAYFGILMGLGFIGISLVHLPFLIKEASKKRT